MPLLLIAFIIIAILVDLLIRHLAKKIREEKLRKERSAALDTCLNLDFSREATSLKRVEVKDPKARILCVDDEYIILDSFRKILALDGYSVDTVESGQEVLGLIQSNNYDFVFTDLRMPSMDGVDVTKSVKHLRPDIDVVIITGFATVETAVECMKHGAVDYIQKPFTEDELLAFVRKILIIRQDRIQKTLIPKVNITHFRNSESSSKAEFEIPGGAFISQGHCWISIKPNGDALVGIDDFAKKILGHIEQIEFPNVGRDIKAGQVLFIVKHKNRKISFLSPLSGRVEHNNNSLAKDLEVLDTTPYNDNWICRLAADQLDEEIPKLKIGKSAIDLFLADLESYGKMIKQMKGEEQDPSKAPGQLYFGALQDMDDKEWNLIETTFFARNA